MNVKNTLAQRGEQVEFSPRKAMTNEEFIAHYQQLWRNVSGASFSFGDTKLIRKALHEIARTPGGRELLEQVPATLPIESERTMPVDWYGAYYDVTNDRMSIKSDQIKSEDTPRGVNIETVYKLRHELRHAAQDARGLNLEGREANIDQLTTVSKLSEAETRAWDNVNNLTESYIRFDSQEHYNADMKTFMNAPFGKDYAPDEVELQNQLRQHNGDLLKAQKAMVAQKIVQMMSPDFMEAQDWRRKYEWQAVQNAYTNIERKDVSEAGAPQAFDKALQYYVQEYGIKKGDIDKPNLSEPFDQAAEGLKKRVQNQPIDSKTQALLKDVFNIEFPSNGTMNQSTVQSPQVPSAINHTGVNRSPTQMFHISSEGR